MAVLKPVATHSFTDLVNMVYATLEVDHLGIKKTAVKAILENAFLKIKEGSLYHNEDFSLRGFGLFHVKSNGGYRRGGKDLVKTNRLAFTASTISRISSE